MKVKIISFDELTDSQKEEVPDNGAGKEDSNYLLIEDNNGFYCGLWSDAMEPEDANFLRDLYWIKDLLLDVYEMGRTNQ